MNKKLIWKLVAIGVFTLIVGVLAFPREGDILRQVGIDQDLSIRLGLDLQGGVELVYEADIDEDVDSSEVLEQVASVIQQRVDPGGTSEAVVQVAENDRIVVQLPDEEDPQSAIDLIGRTAELEFFEVGDQPDLSSVDIETLSDEEIEQLAGGLIPTDLGGGDVSRADASFSQQTGEPIVNLRLNRGESTRAFADLTTRIFNNNTQLLILLDGEPVFGPGQVQEPILTGESQLRGMASLAEAQQTADLIEGGALAAPVDLVAQQTIGPSLGEEAVSASLLAGMIGLMSLAVFLLMMYRLGGLMSVFTMGVYGATIITIFKLSTLTLFGGLTVVLTLAGIAGFVLSIAVAADANILVLERLKEERRAGMKPIKAVESGFDNAWSSIRDASIATLILCAVLYTLASQFGESSIQGFALILGLGVAVNVGSVTFITRNLLRAVARSKYGGKL